MRTYEEILDLAYDTDNAVRSGPGKFEAAADLRVAEELYAIALDGGWEAQGTADGESWTRIGRFLLKEDEQGFVTYEVFEADEECEVAFERHFLHEVYEEDE